MSALNPYQTPGQSPKPELPGKKYLVDPRKLELRESIQLRQSVLHGTWNWLCWQLGLRGDPTWVLTVPLVPEMTADLAEMPQGVSEYFLIFQRDAEQLGFSGRWTSMIVNEFADPTCCMMRMLCPDPRFYLEVAFVVIGPKFKSRHNLVSATTNGEYWATSNGLPLGRRPPSVKPAYLPDVSLGELMRHHCMRLNVPMVAFREFRTFEHVIGNVQEMVDGHIRFQIERGHYRPLDPMDEGKHGRR